MVLEMDLSMMDADVSSQLNVSNSSPDFNILEVLDESVEPPEEVPPEEGKLPPEGTEIPDEESSDEESLDEFPVLTLVLGAVAGVLAVGLIASEISRTRPAGSE